MDMMLLTGMMLGMLSLFLRVCPISISLQASKFILLIAVVADCCICVLCLHGSFVPLQAVLMVVCVEVIFYLSQARLLKCF